MLDILSVPKVKTQKQMLICQHYSNSLVLCKRLVVIDNNCTSSSGVVLEENNHHNIIMSSYIL